MITMPLAGSMHQATALRKSGLGSGTPASKSMLKEEVTPYASAPKITPGLKCAQGIVMGKRLGRYLLCGGNR